MMNNTVFFKLLQAFDPFFPVGSFTLSNGLETYVQNKIVYDPKTLNELLKAYLYILPTSDLGFAAKAVQGESVVLLDEICSASKSPVELRTASEKQCARFLKSQKCLGKYPLLENYFDLIKQGKCLGCYPVAVGLFISDLNADLSLSLEMYCYNLISAMVNNAVKLVPLSQIDGQKCLSTVCENIPPTVECALKTELIDLGISGMGFDFRSMEHEKLYSRLYIS